MRDFPHKPNAQELTRQLQEVRAHYQSRLPASEKALRERNARFFEGRSQEASDLGALEYAFETSLTSVHELLLESTRHAETAISFGLQMEPGQYLRYLALANVTEHVSFRMMLESFDRARYTHQDIDADEIFYLGAYAMSQISAGHFDVARDVVRDGLQAAGASTTDSDAKEVVYPLLLLQQAILERSQDLLAKAIRSETQEHIRNYSNTEVRNYPAGLLDIIGVGHLKLSERLGVIPNVNTVYMPLDLLKI